MKPAVLCVHQIGKVGSTSVVAALQRRFPERTVYQTHALSETGVLHGISWWLDRPQSPRGKFPDHLSNGIELRHRFRTGFANARWFVFCLVRDPVARDASAFFQNLHIHWIHRLPERSRAACRRMLDGEAMTDVDSDGLAGDLAAVFIDEYPASLFDQWFDREMRKLFSIDVFTRPFDAGRGFEIHEQTDVKVLLMRLEDTPRVFASAVQAWLAGSELETEQGGELRLDDVRANDGLTKSYAEIYRRFIARISASPLVAARLGSSRVSSHFYPVSAPQS